MSLLEQDTTKNKQIDKNMIELEVGNGKKNKVICYLGQWSL